MMRWVWQVSNYAKAGDLVKALIVLLSIISASMFLVNVASLTFSHTSAFSELLTPSEKDGSHSHRLYCDNPGANRNGRRSIPSIRPIYPCDYSTQCRENGLDAPKETPIWSLDDLDAPSNG